MKEAGHQVHQEILLKLDTLEHRFAGILYKVYIKYTDHNK